MKQASRPGGIFFWFRRRLSVKKVERASGVRVIHSTNIRVTNPWHAVGVTSSGKPCCQASVAARRVRFLSGDAPPLPLGGCTQPGNCACKYRHFPDRRAGPRRVTDSEMFKNAVSRPVLARLTVEDRRRRGGRRTTDLR